MNVLYAASKLKIFSLLADEELTAAQLAERTGAVPRLLEVLLGACVGTGLLRLKQDRYANTHTSSVYLVEGRPQYLGDLIELQSAEAPAWIGLYDLVRTGEKPPSKDRSEVSPRQFTLAMHNLAMLGEAAALANAVDLSGCRTMVDVGAGSGVYSIHLCRRNVNLRSTLLDAAEVLQVAGQFVEQNELGDRIETRAADITEDSYGENLDAVLLSDVLYQDSATCLTILRSAHRALVEGGTLLIRGYFSDPQGAHPLFGALFTLGRQLDDPSRESITVSLVHDWLRQTGFRGVENFALTARSTCITAAK